MGSILALASVLALLAFIQGVASSISASKVVLRVRKELDTAITELPTLQAQDKESSSVAEDFDKVATLIRLPREGYVQSVEYGELVEWASRRGVVIRLDFRPGDLSSRGTRRSSCTPAQTTLSR
jgi:uncharacterized membrane protein